eukprot:TRINITY_DN15079_c0_g1_i1.p1 TRINITY_DN15079_c0_g1~~TRINITY_DN15079_c0_g1_i1.p1  ORF type:complete len:353 (-),score=64.95 TRINITY_DN15079_c0_g1_i1:70-1092(-)
MALSPAVSSWIVSLLTTLLLGLQWIFLALGLSKCAGFMIRPPKVKTFEPRNTTESIIMSEKCCGDERLSMKMRIVLLLFAAVNAAFLSSLGTFLRRAVLLQSPAFCMTLCKANFITYGASKLFIYIQLYSKVFTFTQFERRPECARKILNFIVGIGSLAFIISIIWTALETTSAAVAQGIQPCLCTAPKTGSIAFVVCDWIVSITMLTYFARPVWKQLSDPISEHNPSRGRWKSVATEQFLLAIAMLLVSPALVAVFIYTNVNSASAGGGQSPAVGSFLVLDLVICCFAQGFSSRKMWTRSPRLCWRKLEAPPDNSENNASPFLGPSHSEPDHNELKNFG